MENASKALIFAASVLVTVMILAIMMYLFNTFSHTATNTENLLSQEELEAFNGQFSVYETSNSEQLRNILKKDNPTTQELVIASQNLNTVSNIVSAANLAIEINRKNNNNYKYNQLEIENTVEIIINLSIYKNDFEFNKYGKKRTLSIFTS
jgi:hypothetical protein